METAKICAAVFICLTVIAVLKQMRSDIIPFAKMAGVVVMALLAVGMSRPLLVYLENIMDSSVSEYAETLLKCLGIGYMTSFCASICRDCSENGLADGVETLGKIEILILALPLIENIIGGANELLEMA